MQCASWEKVITIFLTTWKRKFATSLLDFLTFSDCSARAMVSYGSHQFLSNILITTSILRDIYVASNLFLEKYKGT